MGTITSGPRIRKREHSQTSAMSTPFFRKLFLISSQTFLLFLTFLVLFPNVAFGESSTLTIPLMEWINLGTHFTGNAPVGLKNFGIGYYKDKNLLIIFGGTTASGNKNGQTYLADLTNLVWSSPTDPHGPQARSDMLYGMDVWGSYRNTFVISCGKGDGDVIFNDTWAFDMNYGTWVQIKDVTSMSGPVPQLYSAVGGIDTTTQTGSQVTPNNTMWMSHGTDGKNFYTDLWAQVFRGSWTPNENTLSTVWYKVPATGEIPQGRKDPGGAILPGGRLTMYGGCNNSATDCAIPDVSALVLGGDYSKGDPSSINNAFWSAKSSCLGAREGAAMVMNGITGVSAYSTQVVVFGGKLPQDKPVGVSGEVGVMDASSGVWARVVPRNDSLPKTRAGARMVATGKAIYSDRSNPDILSDILMFGGEALDGSSTNYNDLWILRLYNTPMSSSKMDSLSCIKASDQPSAGGDGDGSSTGDNGNAYFSKSHFILSTLSYIFLLIATTVLRFGLGAVSVWSIGSIYGALIVASYATIFYGFAVAFEDKRHSHFSTAHDIVGLVFLVVLYVLIPILVIISLITGKKSTSHAPQTSPEGSNDFGDDSGGSGSGSGIGKKIATLFHLKSPESSRSPKSFEVNRTGNKLFHQNEDDSPTPMLKPAGDSWMEKRKSVTESAVYNISSRGSVPNSRRVSQSTSVSHHRLGSNGAQLTGSGINNPSENLRQQKNPLAKPTIKIYYVIFHLILFLMGIYIIYYLFKEKENSINNLFFYILIIFMVIMYASWVIFAWIGYPKSRDSMLVKLMTKVAGGRGKINDSEDPNEESESGNRDSRITHRNHGTGTSHRDVIDEEEMDEETKQAELEQEITNREVMVMTIPKRRLTVVNA